MNPTTRGQRRHTELVNTKNLGKYRAMAQVTPNISTGLGAIVSVLMGGALLRHGNLENYRIYFYIAAALYGLGTFGVVVGYNPPPRELQVTLTTAQKFRSLDWMGIFLSTTGLTLFVLALSWYSNPYRFSSAAVLAPFVIGIVLLIAFANYEWLIKKDGILHHGFFHHRNFPISCIIIFAEGVAFFTLNSYFVFEQTVVMGSDSCDASLRLLIFYCGSIVVTTGAGLYTTWTKRLSDPLVLGFSIYTAFAGAMTTVNATTSPATTCGFATLASVANGLVLLNVIIAAQLATPREMIAVTTSLLIAIRGFGGAVGTVVNNAIISNTLKTNLGPNMAAAVLPLGFPAEELGLLIAALTSNDQEALTHIPGITPTIIGAAVGAIQSSYALAFRHCWFVSTSFLALAFGGKSPSVLPCDGNDKANYSTSLLFCQ